MLTLKRQPSVMKIFNQRRIWIKKDFEFLRITAVSLLRKETRKFPANGSLQPLLKKKTKQASGRLISIQVPCVTTRSPEQT